MRYGTPSATYGSFLYGHEDYPQNLLWGIDVDWNEDGGYDGMNLAYDCIDLNIRRGRKSLLSSPGSGFQRTEIGEAKIVLQNEDGYYDPYNTSSPYYPYVKPGKYVQISVKNGYKGKRKYLLSGMIADIIVSDYGDRENRATLIIKDGWQYLNNKVVNIGVQTNIKTGTAIAMVLNEADWPSIWGSSIEEGEDTLDYWWVYNKTAAEAIYELVDSEFGSVWIDGSGKFNFMARGHKPATSISVSQEEMLKNISIPNPWDVVRNVVEIDVHPKAVVQNVPLFTMGEVPAVIPNDTINIWADANYKGESCAVSAIGAVEFTGNTNADGSGTNMTEYLSVGAEAVGGKIALTIHSFHPSTTIYLTDCIIRGDAVYNLGSSTIIKDASTSLEAKSFVLSTPWRTNSAMADLYASFLIKYLSDNTPFPSFTLDSRPDIQFDIDVFTTLSLDISKLGLEAQDFRAAHVEHKWASPTGQRVLTRVLTEKNIPGGTVSNNLMVNGGFEDGLNNWTSSGDVFSVIDLPYEGSYALQVDEMTSGPCTLTSDRVSIIGGEYYRFLAYTKEEYIIEDNVTVDCPVTELACVYSATPTVNTTANAIVGGQGAYAYRTYIKVDFGTNYIPTGVGIVTADFIPNLTAKTSQLNTNILISRVIESWESSTVNWNNKPSVEPTAIGSAILGINEPNGQKTVELSPFYIQEIIDGKWIDKGFEFRARPEGELFPYQRTYTYWYRYIDRYIQYKVWVKYAEMFTYKTIPVYGHKQVQTTVTRTGIYTNKYTFDNAPVVRVVYDPTLHPRPDYSITIKWYDNDVGGNLLRTDALANTNNRLDWNIRTTMVKSPSNAKSFEIVISATVSDVKFFVDNIEAYHVAFY